jgi:hypothetical protein
MLNDILMIPGRSLYLRAPPREPKNGFFSVNILNPYSTKFQTKSFLWVKMIAKSLYLNLLKHLPRLSHQRSLAFVLKQDLVPKLNFFQI